VLTSLLNVVVLLTGAVALGLAGMWVRRQALTIPNDGHPTPAGAQLLARVVIPAIREIAAP
jgi:hypothetical protein